MFQFNQAGNYAVAVTNAAGATNSAGASLTVNFPPATVARPQRYQSGRSDFHRAGGPPRPMATRTPSGQLELQYDKVDLRQH